MQTALQALLMELLSQWGESGFEKYVTTMQAEYQRRAAVLQAAVEKVHACCDAFVCVRLQSLQASQSLDSSTGLCSNIFCSFEACQLLCLASQLHGLGLSVMLNFGPSLQTTC